MNIVRQLATFVMTTSLFATGANTSAEVNLYKVAIYSPGNPPYVLDDNGYKPGIFFDLFNEISEQTDLSFEFVNLPVARAIQAFDDKEIDIEPGINPAWRKHVKVPGRYTISYSTAADVLVFAPEKQQTINDSKALLGKIVGAVRGFSYPEYDTAFSSDAIVRINNLSQTHLLRQLLKGRLDSAIVEHNTFKYLASKQTAFKSISIGKKYQENEVMLRVQPEHHRLLELLNHTLTGMKSSGKIREIYSTYIPDADSGLQNAVSLEYYNEK